MLSRNIRRVGSLDSLSAQPSLHVSRRSCVGEGVDIIFYFHDLHILAGTAHEPFVLANGEGQIDSDM